LSDPSFHRDGSDWNGNIASGIGSVFPHKLEYYPVLGHYNSRFFDWTGRTKVTCKMLEESGEYALVAEEY